MATQERLSLEEKDDSKTFSETSTLEEGKDGSEDHVKIPLSPDARGGDLTLEEFWEYCKNEVPMDTKYGFFSLALLYALINNTVCNLQTVIEIRKGRQLTGLIHRYSWPTNLQILELFNS